VNVTQIFVRAQQEHQAGRLREAEALYRQILSAEPNHAGALHSLGVIAHQVGRLDMAADLLRRAVDLDPGHADAHLNFGVTLAAVDRREEAIAEFRRALALEPDIPETHLNLGAALVEEDRLDEAIDHCRRALELQPGFVPAHYNLGNALRRRKQFAEAAAAYRRALELNANFPEAHNNLGIALVKLGRIDEAMAAYRRALELRPDYSEACFNLGEALAGAGRLEEAGSSFRRALQLKPDNVDACVSLGGILREQGRNEEAIALMRHALAIKPDSVEVHDCLGICLARERRLDEAVAHYRRAIQIRPDFALAHFNLANALADRGEIEESVAGYRRALALLKQDDDTAAPHPSPEIDSGLAATHSNLVHLLNFHPDHDARTISEEQRRWNCKYASAGSNPPAYGNDRDPARRLRIGYVSPDFRVHSVAFFLAPLLEAHDRESFEIYAYSSVRRPDAVTGRMEKAVDVWRDVRWLSDAELAGIVRADRIDILVDLSMHTEHNRLLLFARQPAPVQASWLAYPGSAGVEGIRYRISDRHLEGENAAESQESESGRMDTAVCLPDAWCCYEPLVDFLPVNPLPAEEKKFVTFGSVAKFNKINDRLLSSWARMLAAVPTVRLLMVCPAGQTQERVRTLFAGQGIDLGRIELVAPCPWMDFLRLFHRIDVALDPFPCNGMTVTCHTLWMGVPVITRAGATAVPRAGRSLLHVLGLREWIANSEEDLIQIAAAAANDLPRLAELRRTLRGRMQASPLMDAPRFAHNIEAAFRTMWESWCAKIPSSPE